MVMVTVWTLASQDVARKMPGCYMKMEFSGRWMGHGTCLFHFST